MTFRSTELPEIDGLSEYVASIAGQFCPFIDPSTRARAMRNSVYELSGEEDQIEAAIFYLGLLHTEILRGTRFASLPRYAVLACENLIFRFENEREIDGKGLFAWPHWILKTTYTTVGILFGKFWLGEQEDSRKGEPIPPPPYHLLSIRSAVVRRDPQFFQKAPGLLGALLESDDNGQDVMGFHHLDVVRPSHGWLQPDVQDALAILIASGFYETIKEAAQEKRRQEAT